MPNYYARRAKPVLPAAVQNLLDLHGYAARVAGGLQYHKGAKTPTHWEIYKPELRAVTFGAHGRLPRPRALARVPASVMLEGWIELVDQLNKGPYSTASLDYSTAFPLQTDIYKTLGEKMRCDLDRLSGIPSKMR